MNVRWKKSTIYLLPVFFFIALQFSCKKNAGTDPPPNPVAADTLTTGWSKINTGIASEILDVVFINSSNGLAIDNNHSVYKSSDGGASWQKTYTSAAGLINIGMSSPSQAIVVGRPNMVLVSPNGGASFDSVTLADPLLFEVFCLNSNVVFAIGQYFWKSTDGGHNWVRGTDFSTQGSSICFLDAMTGWVGGNFGLKKTSDGGSSWQTVNTSPVVGNSIYSLQFNDINKGYFATDMSSAKTVNGGTSWINLHNMETGYHDLQFINDNIGYLTDGRYISKTTDGGTSWQSVVRLGQGVFFELHFTDSNHGWAGSSTGAIFRYL